jgi:hypothetical protein
VGEHLTTTARILHKSSLQAAPAFRRFRAAAKDDSFMNTTLIAENDVADHVGIDRRHSMARRSVMHGSGALGVLAAWAFDGTALGLGFSFVTLAFAVLLSVANGLEGWQSARGHRWLLSSAVVLAGFVAVRDCALLVVMNVVAVATLLLLAVRGWNGEWPVADVSLKRLVTSPFTTVSQGVHTGAVAIGNELRTSTFLRAWPKLIWPLAKMVLIGGPIVGLVTLLLASGDAAFGVQVESVAQHLIDLPLPELTRMAMVGSATFALAIGLVTWATRRRSFTAAESEKTVLVRLGVPETFAILGGLSLVLVLFSLVSARCAFDPASCTLPKGVTYSTYAREGFWQLLTVAGIVLITVLSVPHRANATTLTHRKAVRALASLLVATTLPMLLSAASRMMLYEDAYGFTRQRVLSQLICVFISLLLIWRALTLWTWPHRFGIGVVAAGVLVLTGFNAMNPDAFIARKNLERSGTLDASYLRGLSADAAGVLRAVPPGRLLDDDTVANSIAPPPPQHSVSSFNLARACAEAGGDAVFSALCP